MRIWLSVAEIILDFRLFLFYRPLSVAERRKILLRWLKRLKLLRISRIVIPVALIMLVFFAAFTIYGNKVGNFVINVDKQGPSVAVSMTEDMSDLTSHISVPGLDSQDLATYNTKYIPEDLTEGVGVKSDYTNYYYFAVSFYFVNQSDYIIDYVVSMTILDNIGVAEDIVRVLIIEGESDGTIYAKAEETEEDAEKLAACCGYTPTEFVDDTTVMLRRVTDLRAGDYIKYTVVLWLEGNDKLAVDGCEGSRIKMQMDFTAYSAEE